MGAAKKQQLVKCEFEKKEREKEKKRNWSKFNRSWEKKEKEKGTGQMEVGKQHNKNWSKFKGSWTKQQLGFIKWELNGKDGKKEEKKELRR